MAGTTVGEQRPALQPFAGERADLYLASSVGTVWWGRLPMEGDRAVLQVRPGQVFTVDTVSHEGLLEDQGRDPVAYFGARGVPAASVLADGVDIAANLTERDVRVDGPHVVTGPIEVIGARAGDVLRVEFLALEQRVPYGLISSRHGFGALPGEMPPDPGVVSVFCRADGRGAGARGVICEPGCPPISFPLAPFLGLVGVTPLGHERLNSIPPGAHGGNLDIRDLVVGSRLYLPVQVDGAGIFMGDPHFAQGHGEVALTALEAPLRATMSVEVLTEREATRVTGFLRGPMAEDGAQWITVGLDRDLDEAMRKATREALRFLSQSLGIPEAFAYAYLSAAADFVVTQVVDDVKGVHCLIRKADFGFPAPGLDAALAWSAKASAGCGGPAEVRPLQEVPERWPG